MNSKLTQYAFLSGVCYFTCMAIAHFFGIKIPILFVYYDTPFYAYQDKIISFSVCAYIGLFYLASKNRDNAPTAILVLLLTAIGLSAVNVSPALNNLLEEGQGTLPYWLQTLFIYAYTLILAILYFKDAKALKAKA